VKELVGLRVIVPVADLEILAIHRPDAAVEFGIFDRPVEDLLRVRGIADVVDLRVHVGEAGHVHVRAAGVLLHLDVRRFPGPGVGDHMGDQVHVRAAAVLLVERPDRRAGVLPQRGRREGQQ
jgi:hypothetical protein